MITIGLTDDAYERLALVKEEGETFSDAVLRLTDELALMEARHKSRPTSARARLEATAP